MVLRLFDRAITMYTHAAQVMYATSLSDAQQVTTVHIKHSTIHVFGVRLSLRHNVITLPKQESVSSRNQPTQSPHAPQLRAHSTHLGNELPGRKVSPLERDPQVVDVCYRQLHGLALRVVQQRFDERRAFLGLHEHRGPLGELCLRIDCPQLVQCDVHDGAKAPACGRSGSASSDDVG